MNASSTVAVATLCAAATLAACTVHKTEAPALSGPSEFALSLSITATPDSINQDGSSQSSIRVSAKGPDGRPISGLPLRVDMRVHGLLADFGALSARSIVTGTDGVAQVVYTAPPKAVGGNTETCSEAPGICVDIVATPTGTNYQAANSQTATIRLVPPGVILPPATLPNPDFSITPTPASVAVPLIFDASSSSPGQNSQITSYSWNFGDGTATAEGTTVTHAFTSGGTFRVTLTVTNDRGFQASKTQELNVSTTDPFTGDWTFSPTAPAVGTPILFNAQGVQTSAGHNVVQYSWDFGDGATSNGVLATKVYTTPATYQVVLTVTDDLGRRKVFNPKGLTIGTGQPVAVITPSPATGILVGTPITFDASASSATGGATITNYLWTFGDGTSSTVGPIDTKSYSLKGTYTVRLTVTDSLGRAGTATVTIAVN